ncbi:MAG: flagellar M-ring protein FliF [Thermodesulfobacteria bacterium]|nr:flagellar M-ring protein FliF [Thermodesulfobacteriota bacterium]
MAAPSDYISQLKKLYDDLSVRQKIVSAAVVVGVLAGFIALFLFINTPTYKVLYTDLDQKDAGEIVQWLKKKGIPYKVAQGGSVIKVPEDKVYDVRLALASQGLPRGSGVGFELFDKTSLGTTDFVQQVNYQRALQGELEKTIARFPQVKTVRVHIAEPKESLFVGQRQEPSASVVLELKRGQELSQSQVQGIVHLVASAVPRLKKDNVTVVDTTGNVLFDSKMAVKDPLKAKANLRFTYRKRLESYFKHKIQTMLEDALGPKKAVVRVSAEVDFNQVKTNEDRYDPDMVAVRSEEKSEELDKPVNPGGIPGVKGGLADKLQGNVGQQGEENFLRKKKKEISNYEISRVQREILGSVGTLKRLSVAVMVDGKYVEEKGKTVYQPRSPEEIANLKQIVMAAMGYSEERGDEVSVVNVPFTPETKGAGMVSKAVDIFTKLIRPMANLILALIFIFAILKPLLNRFVLAPPEPEESPEETAAIEGEVAGGEAAVAPAFEPMPDVKGELRDLASDYPERAAALIKIWLREKHKEDEGE